MIFAQIQKHWPHRKAEWMLAFVTAGLGVVYTLNPTLFQRPWFASMAHLMPQQWWALICLCIGMTRLVFLLVNGAFQPSPSIRCMGASANCGVWVALSIATVLNDYAAQTLAIFPVFLMFDLLVVRETALEWGVSTRNLNAGAAHHASSG